MEKGIKQFHTCLLPVLVVLFVIEVLLFPIVVQTSYATKSETPEHILTYTKNKLTWDHQTQVNQHGAAELTLFHNKDQHVESLNSDKVVAPGMQGENTIRLKNDAPKEVSFYAVFYRLESDLRLPIQTSIDSQNIKTTSSYPMMDGIEPEQVIEAYQGTIRPQTIHDFDISWVWDFEVNELQDVLDTELGDRASDDLTLGSYIVVEDNNSYIQPDVPITGDTFMVNGYITLLCISALTLFVLLWKRKKEDENENCQSH